MITKEELIKNKDQKVFHTVYEVQDNINNKIYVGCHSTRNLDDNYLGSGADIIEAVNKYEKKNFSRKILAILETRQDAYDLERKIVDKKFVARDDTYNIRIGGGVGVDFGENNPLYGITLSNGAKAKISKARMGMKFTAEHCANIGKGHLGMKHTPEAKARMSASLMGREMSKETRERISAGHMGLVCFNDGKEELRINPAHPIPEGFKRGVLKPFCECCGKRCDKGNLTRWHGKGKCVK